VKINFFRSFLKDSGIYIVPTILAQGVNLFLVPLYTRVLSPSDYGAIDMLKVLSSLALLVVALEISQAFGRFYVDEKTVKGKKIISSTSLFFTIFTFLCFIVICQLFAPFLAKYVLGADGLVTFFRIGSIYIAVKGILLFLNIQFRYELKSKEYAINNILLFIVTALTSIFLAYVLKWGLIGMVIGLLTGSIVSLIYGLILLRSSYDFIFDLNKLREMLKFSFPLVPSGIAIFLTAYIGRIMINNYLSLTEVGLFGIAFRLASVVILLVSGVNRSLMPLVYNNYEKKETPEQLTKIFRLFVSVALLFFVGLSLFANEILILLTTPDFYESSEIIIYLVPAVLLSQMYIFGPGLALAKKTKIIMWISIGTAIITIFLNWIFIPQFGYKGAAIATLITYLCVFVVTMYYSQKHYYIPYEWGNIILSVVFSIPLAAAGSFIEFGLITNIILKMLIMCLVPIVIIFSGLIKKKELTQGYVLARSFIVSKSNK